MAVLVRVEVSLKAEVLDVQGATLERSLVRAGYAGVSSARIGKVITLEFDESLSEAEIAEKTKHISAEFLTNPVIEEYKILKN